MIFITNSKNTGSLPETTAEDNVYIFCKDTDTFKVDAVNMLLKQDAKLEFLPVAGKDDMLICLGAIIGQAEAVTILVPSIPVPKRYADKVMVSVAKPVKRRKKKKTQESEKGETSEEITDDSNVMEHFMNRPEGDEIGVSDDESDVIEDPTARKIFDLIGIRSKDISFSWPTQMLMLNICSKIAEAEDDEELKQSIKSISCGDRIWDRLKDNLAAARGIVSEM